MKIPLAKGQYLIDGERAVNLYPVFNRADNFIWFRATEGLETFSTISGQPIRGVYAPTKDPTKMYVVAGTKFYRVLTDGTWLEKGTLLTSQGLVEMSDNGDLETSATGVFISDGIYAYTYQPTTDAFAQVTDADFPGAASNCFLDGYTIVVEPGTQKAWSSQLYDFTSWVAVDFASAESNPDDLLRVAATPGGLLMMLGRVSTEFFQNTGLAGFPFSRIPGARFGYGLEAFNSLAWNDQAAFFLARTTVPQGGRVIVRVDGYQTTIVSDEGVHQRLATLTNIENAEGFAYMEEGHSFYELTFPSDGLTLVYDAKEGLFHERMSIVNGVETRHRARCYAKFNGHHMVGDYSTGKIYKLTSDAKSEDGQEIRRVLYPPEFTDRDGNAIITIPELRVPMKMGVGLDGTGQGTDPVVMFRYSKDKGNKWSNEKTASIGKIGEHKKRFPRFDRMGIAREWRFELAVSDPVEVEFKGPLVVPE